VGSVSAFMHVLACMYVCIGIHACMYRFVYTIRSVVQYVAVRRCVLRSMQCVTACCTHHYSARLHDRAGPCSVLQCVAVCCAHHLQCVAVCCSVLQCLVVCCTRHYSTQQHDRFFSCTHTQMCHVKSHTCQSAGFASVGVSVAGSSACLGVVRVVGV